MSKEKLSAEADRLLTDWANGRTFLEETRDQSYIDFAVYFASHVTEQLQRERDEWKDRATNVVKGLTPKPEK